MHERGDPRERRQGGRRSHRQRHAVGDRQPDRQDVRDRDHRRDRPRDGLPPDEGRRRRLRPHDLRPGVHQHRVDALGHHLHRRRQGHPRVPRLSRSSSSRSSRPTSRSPTCSSTASSRRRTSSTSGRTRSRSTRSCTRTSRSSWAASATTRTRWGCCSARSARSRRSTGRQRDPGPRQPRDPDDPADREDADARGLRLPAHDGHALRLSGQRPAVPRQLPEHDVQDDRAQVRARSRGSSARSTSSSSSTPTTSRTARPTRSGRWAPRRSTRTRPSPPASPRSTARCTAAPTRRSCGCCTRIETKDNIPDFIEGREGRRRAPDGLRPPRLQELRPAGEDHQDRRPTTSSRSPASTRCWRSRSSSRRSRSRTTTSSRASSTPTSTSTPGLIYEALGLPVDMFPVMFAIPRTSGWIAQWLELVIDKEQKIARPRQIYTGDRAARLRADGPARHALECRDCTQP